MNLRVSNLQQTTSVIASLRSQTASQASLQNQLSSGVKLAKASDNPADYALLLQAQSGSARYDTYLSTITDATASLNAGVSTLQDVNTKLSRSNQIALQAINSSTDQPSSDALASELDGILGSLVTDANTQVDGKYLFSGTATTTKPFSIATTNSFGQPATIAYNGSDQRSNGLVGPDQTVDTKYTGSEIFQKPGSDVFKAVITLRDTLRNTSLSGAARTAALTQSLTDLQNARQSVSNVTGDQSAALANLDSLQNTVTDQKFNSDERIGTLKGTDYASAVLSLQEAQNTYQATLGVAAKILQPSLLSFIQ